PRPAPSHDAGLVTTRHKHGLPSGGDPHGKKRLLRCSLCSYTTQHLGHMKQHHLVHTGERPYRCNDCGKDFTSNGNLALK
ncbi:hypothetical protein V5799_017636, partial [Amblyomma americanum]